MQKKNRVVKTKMETGKVDFQFVTKTSDKKESATQKFEHPQRECKFCGRVTNHSANLKVCLICGLPNGKY